MAACLPALTIESRIKRELRKHLKGLGFERGQDGALMVPRAEKEALRALHRGQRLEKISSSQDFISASWKSLHEYFADGDEINIDEISPQIERVESNTWQSDLFRLAALTWSVPVSSGYGRRMRFLVWDQYNGKLIGIFALGDPVFNLRARDDFIGWTVSDRKQRLVNVMDAYVLGAVPPYSFILGGKLVACLTNAVEVQNAFRRIYGEKVGIISGEKKQATLALITTTSSLGRSSLYNRLKLAGRTYFKPIGFTEGWGHFHVPSHLFELMRKLLRARNHPYASNHAYGEGPNWKLRTVKAALELAGLNPNLMRHGIGRQVFISELANNSCDILCGKSDAIENVVQLSAREIGDSARDRWIRSRAGRDSRYLDWECSNLLPLIYHGHVKQRELLQTIA